MANESKILGWLSTYGPDMTKHLYWGGIIATPLVALTFLFMVLADNVEIRNQTLRAAAEESAVFKHVGVIQAAVDWQSSHIKLTFPSPGLAEGWSIYRAQVALVGGDETPLRDAERSVSSGQMTLRFRKPPDDDMPSDENIRFRITFQLRGPDGATRSPTRWTQSFLTP